MSEIDTAQNDSSIEPTSSLAAVVSNNLTSTSRVSQENASTWNDSDRNEENVTAVVTKAKRAATFLWTLLHAQVRTCRIRIFHFFSLDCDDVFFKIPIIVLLFVTCISTYLLVCEP